MYLFQSNTSELTLLDREDSVDSQDDIAHNWTRVNSVSHLTFYHTISTFNNPEKEVFG